MNAGDLMYVGHNYNLDVIKKKSLHLVQGR